MRSKKFLVMVLVVIMSAFTLAGCTNTDSVDKDKSVENEDMTEKNKTVEQNKQEKNAENSEGGREEEGAVDYGYTQEEGDFSFSDLANLEFIFSSGAGAWSTELTVLEDGSFTGSFHDTNMGEYTEEYPNGTINVCEFTGKFTEPIKMNDYTYLFEVNDIKYKNEVGTEEIVDKVRYCYTDSYGIAEYDTIHLYLSGAPIKDLPQEYINSVISSGLSQEEQTELPFYGLYNVNLEAGFWSTDSSEEVSDTPSVDERIASVEYSVEEQYNRLDKEGITQSEMNDVAAQVYQLWDDELNWIWGELEDSLDTDTMESLRIEQREWIKKKETAMKKAGAEAEGGSIQPLLEFSEGTEMTEKRVRELADLLR